MKNSVLAITLLSVSLVTTVLNVKTQAPPPSYAQATSIKIISITNNSDADVEYMDSIGNFSSEEEIKPSKTSNVEIVVPYKHENENRQRQLSIETKRADYTIMDHSLALSKRKKANHKNMHEGPHGTIWYYKKENNKYKWRQYDLKKQGLSVKLKIISTGQLKFYE